MHVSRARRALQLRARAELATAPGKVSTLSHPAYWLEPGEQAGGYNPDTGGSLYAVNTTKVTADELRKTVEVGANGDPNVIKYDSQINFAEKHKSVYVETPTTYLTSEFKRHFRYDPASKEMHEYRKINSENPGPGGFVVETSNVPLIVSTADGKHAMAVWSPDERRSGLNYSFHQFNFSDTWANGNPQWDTAKIGVTFGVNKPGNQINTTSYVIAGDLETVKQKLSALYAANPTGVRRTWPPADRIIG